MCIVKRNIDRRRWSEKDVSSQEGTKKKKKYFMFLLFVCRVVGSWLYWNGFNYLLSTDAVKAMDFHRRNCLLPDEDLTLADPRIKMEAFQNYSRIACNLECKARSIMADCNCLPYFYPAFSQIWNKSTDCDLEGLMCLDRNTSKGAFINDVTQFWPKIRPLSPLSC